MVEHKEKKISSFKNVNGESLILTISKSNGYSRVTITKKINAFSQQKTDFLVISCAIALLVSLLGINTRVIILCILFVTLIYCKSFFIVRSENVLIIKGFGYQVSKQYLFRKSTSFIPYEKVQNIFVNEVIFRNRVIYLLTLLTKSSPKENSQILIPLFTNLLPRIDCLQIIYRNIKYLKNR